MPISASPNDICNGPPSPADARSGSPAAPALERYRCVRRRTEQLCRPLAVEDYVIQTMTDVSPPKWNIAHTSWFFETFLLKPHLKGYEEFHPLYGKLFNSYYAAVGERHPRPRRGMLSRPTVDEVYQYRRFVDGSMGDLLSNVGEATWREIAPLVVLGLNHEQQHQELLLSDLKHILAENPLKPVYRPRDPEAASRPTAMEWMERPGGVVEIGFEGGGSGSGGSTFDGFCFDNEQPRHRALLQPHCLGSRLVANAEYLEFIEAGGYRQEKYWLSDGWAAVQENAWQAPLYWARPSSDTEVFTLAGMAPLDPNEPVCHVSYYEAEAYARWRGARLPTECEWEAAAVEQPLEGNFADAERLHPRPAAGSAAPCQFHGDVWEWTGSPYSAYPGYRPVEGAIGEYNGKFMCNQMVLRGGSCFTPADHMRPSYRNFFHAHARWQMSGIRLAQD